MTDVLVIGGGAAGMMAAIFAARAGARQKNALYEIVGALCQKEADAVGKMSFGEVIQVIKENWSVLTGFFTL